MRSDGLASFGQTLAQNVDSAKIHGAVAKKPQMGSIRKNALGLLWRRKRMAQAA
jgi:hypothetical protein